MSPQMVSSFIDAHCHLERAYYGDDLLPMMQRARARGLTHFVGVGASGVTKGADEVLRLCDQESDVFAAIGVHPQESHLAHQAELDHIDRLAAHPKVVSIGEVGLDYYVETAPRAEQHRAFRAFLQMARRHNKPIMLHIRDAHEDAWRILDEEGLPESRGVVHCFTAGPKEAAQYLERGMYLSIPGVVTFKNAAALREAIAIIPMDRMLIETDSPYLAPVPHRGKKNEPGFLADTQSFLAGLKNMAVEDFAATCHANTCRLFGLPGRPGVAKPAD